MESFKQFLAESPLLEAKEKREGAASSDDEGKLFEVLTGYHLNGKHMNSYREEGKTPQAIHDEIKNNPTLKARLQSALKAGGLEALKAIFNHPLFNIPAETIKGFIEAE